MNQTPRLRTDTPLWLQITVILAIGLGYGWLLYQWVNPILS